MSDEYILLHAVGGHRRQLKWASEVEEVLDKMQRRCKKRELCYYISVRFY